MIESHPQDSGLLADERYLGGFTGYRLLCRHKSWFDSDIGATMTLYGFFVTDRRIIGKSYQYLYERYGKILNWAVGLWLSLFAAAAVYIFMVRPGPNDFVPLSPPWIFLAIFLLVWMFGAGKWLTVRRPLDRKIKNWQRELKPGEFDLEIPVAKIDSIEFSKEKLHRRMPEWSISAAPTGLDPVDVFFYKEKQFAAGWKLFSTLLASNPSIRLVKD